MQIDRRTDFRYFMPISFASKSRRCGAILTGLCSPIASPIPILGGSRLLGPNPADDKVTRGLKSIGIFDGGCAGVAMVWLISIEAIPLAKSI